MKNVVFEQKKMEKIEKSKKKFRMSKSGGGLSCTSQGGGSELYKSGGVWVVQVRGGLTYTFFGKKKNRQKKNLDRTFREKKFWNFFYPIVPAVGKQKKDLAEFRRPKKRENRPK